MATTTATAPISIAQINQAFYVGEAFLDTIQKAVTFARNNGNNGAVIIPQSYTGSDTIEAVFGGSATVYIVDERNGQRQTYLWYGNAYIAEPIVAKGGISSIQLNHFLYAGTGRFTTIQLALDYAATYGANFCVVIQPNYTGTEPIESLHGSSAVYLSDMRTDEWQNYFWNGTAYEPSTFAPLGPVVVENLAVTEDLTVGGNASIAGQITAPTAIFDECLVDNSPVRTFTNTPDGPGEGMVWPPDGLAYSGGDHWAKTLAFDVPHFDDEGMSFGYAGGHGKIYVQPGAAGGGYDWYTVTPAGVKTLVAQFSSGQLRASALVATSTVGADPIPNSIWLDNAGRAGRLITVGPSVGQLNGISFLAIDSNSSTVKLLADLTWETSLNAAQFAVDYLKVNRNTTFSGAVNIAGKLTTAQIENTGEFWTHLNNVGSIPGAGKNSGTVIGWNVPTGYGNTVFANYNGDAGGGGFRWLNVAPNTDIGPTTPPIMDLDGLGVLRVSRVESSTLFASGAVAADGGFFTAGGAGSIAPDGIVHCASLVMPSATNDFVISQDGGSTFIDGGAGGRLLLNTHREGGLIGIHGALSVDGSKNFKIINPTDPNKWLVHACLEGPENGVFYRGEAETVDGSAEIELPHYFEALVMADYRSAQITQIDDEDGAADFAMFKVSRVKDGKFTVKSSVPNARFFWQVNAVRGDIPNTEVEPPMTDVDRKLITPAPEPPPKAETKPRKTEEERELKRKAQEQPKPEEKKPTTKTVKATKPKRVG